MLSFICDQCEQPIPADQVTTMTYRDPAGTEFKKRHLCETCKATHEALFPSPHQEAAPTQQTFPSLKFKGA
jgi:hypothetical protein